MKIFKLLGLGIIAGIFSVVLNVVCFLFFNKYSVSDPVSLFKYVGFLGCAIFVAVFYIYSRNSLKIRILESLTILVMGILVVFFASRLLIQSGPAYSDPQCDKNGVICSNFIIWR